MLATCCSARGIDLITWSGCGVSMQDLGDMVSGLDLFGWDVVCLGLKNSESQTFHGPSGHTVVSSRGSGRGAPAVLVNARLTPATRETASGVYLAATLLDLRPSLGILSIHAPTGGTGDETSMEEALTEVGEQTSQWSLRYSDIKWAIGGDLNCQFSCFPGVIGPGAAGEGLKDAHRASLYYSFFATWDVRVSSTYTYHAHTRGAHRADGEVNAQTDYFALSRRVGASGVVEAWIPTAPPSDHKLLRTCTAYVPRPKEARRRFFAAKQHARGKSGFVPNTRIPINWEARGYDKFRDLVEVDRRVDIDAEIGRIHTLAFGEAGTRREPRILN